MISRMIDAAGGVYELARLGVLTRFRFNGSYWRWRRQTAFGGPAREMGGAGDVNVKAGPRRREMLIAALRYGRWMHRVRRAR